MADPRLHRSGSHPERCEWCGTFSPVSTDPGEPPARGVAGGSGAPEGRRVPSVAVGTGLECNAGAVVFVAMEGLATLASHSAQALGPALTRIGRCLDLIVAAHDGEWDGELGSYQLFFQAFTDDLVSAASRAVRATLELARQLDETLQELAAEGIVIGPVFAVHVAKAATLSAGERWRPVPEVMELGQELLGVGTHYGIVTSDAVVAAIGHLVEAVPLDAALRRGRGAVFELGAWRGAAAERPTWAAEGFSVACDEDIQHLLKRWKEVRDGEGSRSLTLIGPDGAGKRRLVEEFLSQIPDGRGLRLGIGAAGESTRLVPFHPLCEALLRLIDVDPSDDDEAVRRRLRHAARRACRALNIRDIEREAGLMAALSGALLGLEMTTPEALEVAQLDAESLRKHGFYALQRLLQGMTIGSPRVLVLENLHDADAATLDFLDHFGSTSKGQGALFIVITAQPSLLTANAAWGRGWWRHENLSVEALYKDELVELGRGVAGRAGPVPDWLLEELAQKADGDPYWMEQLTWLAAAKGGAGLLPSSRPGEVAEPFGFVADDELFEEDDEFVIDEGPEEPADLTWPDDLEATVAQRIDALDTSHRRTLAVAALIGNTFPAAWVAALVGQLQGAQDAAAELRDLETQGFLRRRLQEDVYRFRGEALWRCVRGRVEDDDLRTWNRLLATMLEEDKRGDRGRAAYARVAVHHHLGDHEARALRCYALGARRARRISAFEEARACFDEALGLLGEGDVIAQSRDALALYLGRGTLRLEAGDLGRAVEDLEVAVELARVLEDGRRECEALFTLSSAYDRQGLLDRADKSLGVASVASVDHDDPRLQVLQLRHVGWLKYRTGDVRAAREFLERAVSVARHSGVDLRQLVRAIDDLTVFRWLSDEDEAALEGFRDLLAILRRAGPAQVDEAS